MTFDEMVARKMRLHPRVRIGNGLTHGRSRRLVYGPVLDGRYHGDPRCSTQVGALKKAEALSRELFEAEKADPSLLALRPTPEDAMISIASMR